MSADIGLLLKKAANGDVTVGKVCLSTGIATRERTFASLQDALKVMRQAHEEPNTLLEEFSCEPDNFTEVEFEALPDWVKVYDTESEEAPPGDLLDHLLS